MHVKITYLCIFPCNTIERDLQNLGYLEDFVKRTEIDLHKINFKTIYIIGFFNYIFDYIRSCCLKIQEILRELVYIKNDLQYDHSIYYSRYPTRKKKSLTYGKDFKELIKFLENKKIIENIKPKDIRYKNNQVTKEKNKIAIKMSKMLGKITLVKIGGNLKIEKYEYGTNNIKFDYNGLFRYFWEEEERLKSISREILPLLKALLINLISMISSESGNEEERKGKNHLARALIQNEIFMSSIRILMNQLDNNFNELINLSNQI